MKACEISWRRGVAAIVCVWVSCLGAVELPPQRPQNAARVDAIAAWLPERPGGFGAHVSDRVTWERVAALPRLRGYAAAAEEFLSVDPPALTEDLYFAYFKTGERQPYLDPYYERTRILDALILAECLEGKGRFLPQIRRFVAAICDERVWTGPWHDRDETHATKATLVAWNGTMDVLELGTVERAWILSTALSWLKGELGAELEARARDLIARRVLMPHLRQCRESGRGKPVHWWFYGRNNWNTVCHGSILATAFLLHEDRRERAEIVEAAERGQAYYFIQGFKPDGYCHEGMGYWNYGFGHELMMAALVRTATRGRMELLDGELARRCGRYGQMAQFQPGFAPSFADGGGAPAAFCLELVHRRWPDLVPSLPEAGILAEGKYGRFTRHDCRQVGLLAFAPPSGPVAETSEKLPLRTWFESAEVYFGRPAPQEKRSPFSLAIKGGNNGEPHNHNDLGSYAIMLDGWQVAGDLGRETYTFRTFSGWRYDSPLINSFGHPVPRLRDGLQKTGRDYVCQVMRKSFTDETDTLVYNLAPAYAKADVRELVREFAYNRAERSITVTDSIDQRHGPFETAIVVHDVRIERGNDPLHFVLADPASDRRVRVDISATSGKGVGVILFEEDLVNYGQVVGRRVAIRFAADISRGTITVKYTAL